MKHQKQWVKSILLKQGYITRNYALSQKVTRLGAIILTLKSDGMKIQEGEYIKTEKGKDFIYRMEKPVRWEVYSVGGVVVKRVPVY